MKILRNQDFSQLSLDLKSVLNPRSTEEEGESTDEKAKAEINTHLVSKEFYSECRILNE